MKNKLLVGVVFVCMSFFVIGAAKGEEKKMEKKAFKMPEEPIIVVETNQGMIEMKLFSKIAPLACENMICLAEKAFYNGIIFHRIIKGFMLQGGDPTGTGRGGQSIWVEKFKDEFSDNVKFDRKGLLAMANAGPNTNGSQFFIAVAPTPWLNGKHTIFGEIISGYEVVQKIENSPADSSDRPLKEQKILKMYLKK